MVAVEEARWLQSRAVNDKAFAGALRARFPVGTFAGELKNLLLSLRDSCSAIDTVTSGADGRQGFRCIIPEEVGLYSSVGNIGDTRRSEE
jgi:hypothetical protein